MVSDGGELPAMDSVNRAAAVDGLAASVFGGETCPLRAVMSDAASSNAREGCRRMVKRLPLAGRDGLIVGSGEWR
jgi:hypothetical protein